MYLENSYATVLTSSMVINRPGGVNSSKAGLQPRGVVPSS